MDYSYAITKKTYNYDLINNDASIKYNGIDNILNKLNRVNSEFDKIKPKFYIKNNSSNILNKYYYDKNAYNIKNNKFDESIEYKINKYSDKRVIEHNYYNYLEAMENKYNKIHPITTIEIEKKKILKDLITKRKIIFEDELVLSDLIIKLKKYYDNYKISLLSNKNDEHLFIELKEMNDICKNKLKKIDLEILNINNLFENINNNYVGIANDVNSFKYYTVNDLKRIIMKSSNNINSLKKDIRNINKAFDNNLYVNTKTKGKIKMPNSTIHLKTNQAFKDNYEKAMFYNRFSNDISKLGFNKAVNKNKVEVSYINSNVINTKNFTYFN